MDLLSRFRFLNLRLTVLLVLLFIATVVSTVYLTQSIRDSRALIEDGSNAVGASFILQDLMINLSTAESAQRGYVISGDPVYLQPFSSSVKNIPAELKSLENPIYGIKSSELKYLKDSMNKRLDGMQSIIDLRERSGPDPAMAAISTNKGFNLTTQIQKEVQALTQHKLEPITPLYIKTRNSLKTATLVAGTTILFAFTICLLISWYFQRALFKERATENVKNEFLSLASHQLRTPATNVKQYLGILREGYLGKLKPEQLEALDVANRNNDIEINIINDLLGVAKLDLHKINLRKKPVNLYSLVKEVVDEYKPKIRERRQVVKFELPDKKVQALVDPVYMKGVIENLLDNAIKYSHTRKHIFIGIKTRPRKVVISVKDEGVGVKRKDVPKLFNKFSRVPNIFSDATESTGLGLYWVKQIVLLHGGRVGVTSKAGKGSTFFIELPRYHEPHNHKP